MLNEGKEVIKPRMDTYVCKYPENNCIYSDVQPEVVFSTLAEYFKENNIKFKPKDDKWKLTFNYTSNTASKIKK